QSAERGELGGGPLLRDQLAPEHRPVRDRPLHPRLFRPPSLQVAGVPMKEPMISAPILLRCEQGPPSSPRQRPLDQVNLRLLARLHHSEPRVDGPLLTD